MTARRRPRVEAPRATAKRLWGYARKMPLQLLVGTIAVIIYSALEPLIVLVLKPFLDSLSAQSSTIVTGVAPLHDPGMGDINRLMMLLLLLGVLLAVSEFGHVFLFDYVGQYLVRDLRSELFSRMQHLSLSFFDDQSTGHLMSKATNDISVLQNRLNFELTRLAKCPLSIVGTVAVMIHSSPRLTVVSFLTIAVLVPLLGHASRLMKQHSSALQDRLGDLSSRLQESLAAIRVVQCFGATEAEIARFEDENLAVRRATMRAVRVRSLLQPLIHVVGLLGLLAVVWFGGYEMIVRRSLTGGDLFALVLGLQLITTNFKQLGRARLALSEALSAAEKVFAVIDTEAEIKDPPDARPLIAAQGRVTFERVGFRYRTGGDVLAEVDLELQPGEAIAVIGASGAGKSALANLIPRLYDVTAGRVLIDGQDVRQVTLQSLRAEIGIVPQETVLFRGTVRYNIAYGRPGATDDEVKAAAVAANADRFIQELPDGYETLVGERGKTLSGGQAQRVAIARAILRDPKILILDEATSSLDTQNEALVQEALERLMRDRTTLVIAHRLSTIQNCARIIVLQEGRIVEQGTHAELLAIDGHYRSAWQLQSREGTP